MTSQLYLYPQVVNPTPQQKQPVNWMPVILFALLIAAFVQWQNQGWPFESRPHDQDQTIVEPTDDTTPPTPSDKPAIKDTYVVRVYETQADQNPAWLVKQIQNDKFWHLWLKAERGVQFFTFDPMAGTKENEQSKQVVAAAKERGISPPFWTHVSRDGDKKVTILSMTPFSESLGEEDWKKIILGAVKQ